MVPNTVGGEGEGGRSVVVDRARQGRLKNKGSIVYVI